MKKNPIVFMWAFKKLREWLKINCPSIEVPKTGDLKYCLEKYFETLGRKKKNKRSGLILLEEYNNPASPIYKGIKVKGLTLAKKKSKKSEYVRYIGSKKWKDLKKSIIEKRGNACERCNAKPKQIDLHHKTYIRLFNEEENDVMLLCRGCHEKEHNKTFF